MMIYKPKGETDYMHDHHEQTKARSVHSRTHSQINLLRAKPLDDSTGLDDAHVYGSQVGYILVYTCTPPIVSLLSKHEEIAIDVDWTTILRNGGGTVT